MFVSWWDVLESVGHRLVMCLFACPNRTTMVNGLFTISFFLRVNRRRGVTMEHTIMLSDGLFK